MKTKVIPTGSAEAIPAAYEILKQHGLVVFPTDTVYGLAARVDSTAAIDRIFKAKGRDFNKAIAVLIGDLPQIHRVAASLPFAAGLLAERFWPGALTIVVTRLTNLPANLSPDQTIGVRIPDHPFARQLLQITGPLATTSANLSGQANPYSADDVIQQLDGLVDLILDGGMVQGGVPSTVVGWVSGDLKIFRQGAITEEEIIKTLNPL